MTAPGVFEVVVPDSIWVTERPVWFSGVRLRSRTTVVRLSGDALWVHSPCTPTDDVCAALDALGEVRWIVVPNRFHHLQTPATAARYPDALVVGPRSAEARNPRVRSTMGTDDPAYIRSTPELTPIQLRGVPFLDETVFFHPASGSLIAADLLMSACARDHWTWRAAARITGRYEKVGTPPDVRMHARASAEVAESIAQMRALPLQRILVAHADPITDRPAQRLAEAWDFAVPPHLRQPGATL
ncbi:hypothetical protein BE20_02320 [Sorangium cellulosum]|uniref:DUF4336 domain-containing protein n=1 Tax=Sorangium cellulosum TaxID=56 RepID=A0A150RFQ6_SORCE|nr:hypothetical protein BE18_02090 [Sorangium cellulosum]KYF89923.1 hypothetical protein BE20_02320 [Sorangium cellulosum]